MKTQAEIRREIDRLLEEGRLKEADALVDQLIPISAEEFRRRLEAAPYDDEPVTARQRERYDDARTVIGMLHSSVWPAAESQ